MYFIYDIYLKVDQLMSILMLLVASTLPWKTNKIDVPCNILLNFSHNEPVSGMVDNFSYKTYHTTFNTEYMLELEQVESFCIN